MEYNFITNIQNCYTDIPALLYYSHIPTAVAMSFLGIFLLFKSKHNKTAGYVLFFLSVAFLVFILLDLKLWLTYSSITMMFLWSLYGMLYVSMYLLGLYFVYVAIEGKDVSNKIKYILGLLLLPIVILTPTKLNLLNFDIINCQPSENIYFMGLQYSLGFLLIIWAGVFIYKKYKITKKEDKKKIIFTTIGVLLFFITFLWPEIIGSITENFVFTQYGLFGAPIFVCFLVYSIVRFKTLDIKLIGAQALVWALVILVGSQYFYLSEMPMSSVLLTAVTLLISAIVGLIIVRSVKKEIALREELQVANENQQLLIRFITHQVKGFFTKSKMVFSSVLDGDMGEISEPVRDILKIGLESDNKAVDMVQEVLKASSLRTGEMKYNFEEVNMGDFVKEITDGFRETALAKGLQYEVILPKEEVKAKVDKLQMTQVFRNLIDNSVRYTLKGEIKISLKLRNTNLFFSIQDTGVGLSESDKAKLFKEGGRGDESVKVNVNSTGYGLFIVKKIVEGHGGKIWAESAGRGHGSHFHVELPAIV